MISALLGSFALGALPSQLRAAPTGAKLNYVSCGVARHRSYNGYSHIYALRMRSLRTGGYRSAARSDSFAECSVARRLYFACKGCFGQQGSDWVLPIPPLSEPLGFRCYQAWNPIGLPPITQPEVSWILCERDNKINEDERIAFWSL